LSADDYARMAAWGANVVRIALNQDFWLAGAARHDPGYAARVDQNVAWANGAGMDVVLDLHWSDRGDLAEPNPGQQLMADDNSLRFWSEVAARYQENPRVLFELYNEPHDVSWQLWQRGGMTEEGWRAAGMQALYDAVRATGATNLVIVGGLDWAFDLSGVPTHPIAGYNLVYATHAYDFAGKNTPLDWARSFAALAEQAPIFVTEFGDFGCAPELVQTMVDYWERTQLSWSAWAWYDGGCEFPSLISDWAGTPNPVGEVIRAALSR
jgi:hypothetical protein